MVYAISMTFCSLKSLLNNTFEMKNKKRNNTIKGFKVDAEIKEFPDTVVN